MKRSAIVTLKCFLLLGIVAQYAFAVPSAGAALLRLSTLDGAYNYNYFYDPGDQLRVKASYDLNGPATLVLLGGSVSGEGISVTLPWQYGFLSGGEYSTFWDITVPDDALGTATVRVSFIGLGDIAEQAETRFSVVTGSAGVVSVGEDICGMCHSEVADQLAESRHSFIGCEACHGSGSLHASGPSPDTIKIDRNPESCASCHSLGGSGRAFAEDGLIQSQQQYSELKSGGMSNFACVTCHNPHVSISAAPDEAIKKDCTECHSVTVNAVHINNGVDCVDCHMPLAVKKTESSGAGNYLKGDVHAHIFTINPDAAAWLMYRTDYSGDEPQKYARGFLTLNFTCLGCHDGSYGQRRSFEWAYQASGLVHSK